MKLDSPQIYAALMVVSGLALAMLQWRHPAIAGLSLPPIVWLILASLVFDIGLMFLGSRVGLRPLPPPARIVGFLAGAGLYLGLMLLRPA